MGHAVFIHINQKIEISTQKYLGYTKAMQEAGLAIDPSIVYLGELSLKAGFGAACQMNARPRLPDAVVAENDITAIGCLKYFSQKGIKVPADVAVIGFDNIQLSALIEPPLSTIALPIAQLGLESTRILCSVIENPHEKPKTVILNNELVIRSSTDPSAPVEFSV